MKICELKINNFNDRDKLVAILANAGYKVSVNVIQRGWDIWHGSDYFVIVEDDREERVDV